MIHKIDFQALEAQGKLADYIEGLCASYAHSKDIAQAYVIGSAFANAIDFLLKKAIEVESVRGTGEIRYADNKDYETLLQVIDHIKLSDGLLIRLIEKLGGIKRGRRGYGHLVHSDLVDSLIESLASLERTYSDVLILGLLDLCEIFDRIKSNFGFFNKNVSDSVRESFESKLLKECQRWEDESNISSFARHFFAIRDLPDRIILEMLDYYREHEVLSPVCSLLEVRTELSVEVKEAVENLVVESAPKCALRGDVKSLTALLERSDLSARVKDVIRAELPHAIRSCEVAGKLEDVLYVCEKSDEFKRPAEAALPNTIMNAGKRADVDSLCFFYSRIPEGMRGIAEDALVQGLTKAVPKMENDNFSAFEQVIEAESIPDFVKIVAIDILFRCNEIPIIYDLIGHKNAPQAVKQYAGKLDLCKQLRELVSGIVQNRVDVKSVLDAKIKPPRRDGQGKHGSVRQPTR